MKVFRPVRSNHLNQRFGANNACINRSTGKVVKKSKKGCPKGYINFYTNYLNLKGHNGEDWRVWHSEPLYFPVHLPQAGGWWAKDASDLSGGLGVDVISKKEVSIVSKTGETYTGYIKFRFWHLKKAWDDKDVKLGEYIGLCDNTGASSGDHLHWAMKFCDKNGYGIKKDNGYYGATDFREWFDYDNRFIVDILKIREQNLTAIQTINKFVANSKWALTSSQKKILHSIVNVIKAFTP